MPDTLPAPTVPPVITPGNTWWSRLSPEVRAIIVTAVNAGLAILFLKLGIAAPPPVITPQQQPLVLIVGGGQVSAQPVPITTGK